MNIGSEKDWDFDGGRLPLDFANTAEWHLSSEPIDLLDDYTDLVSWSAAAGLIDQETARSLLAEAEMHPEAASSAFDRALELREATFGVFLAVSAAEPTKDSDLAVINAFNQEAAQDLRIRQTLEGFELAWDCDALDCMAGPIARSASDLLTSDELDRIGLCAEDDRGCGYLFFDTSRNRSRRWCSMEACGNRAKAKRYYQRQTGITNEARSDA